MPAIAPDFAALAGIHVNCVIGKHDAAKVANEGAVLRARIESLERSVNH